MINSDSFIKASKSKEIVNQLYNYIDIKLLDKFSKDLKKDKFTAHISMDFEGIITFTYFNRVYTHTRKAFYDYNPYNPNDVFVEIKEFMGMISNLGKENAKFFDKDIKFLFFLLNELFRKAYFNVKGIRLTME